MPSHFAHRQADVAAALTRSGPVPPGFQADAIHAAARGLVAKRAGELAADLPVLAADLGTQWLPTVARWSRLHPRGSRHSGATDLGAWWIAQHDAGEPFGTATPSDILRRDIAFRIAARARRHPLRVVRVGAQRYWFAVWRSELHLLGSSALTARCTGRMK